MPPVTRQEIRPDGFLVESIYGTVEITITRAGSQYTFTYLVDGVQQNQITTNNPSAAQIETWANERLSEFLQQRFGFAIHVFSVDPLTMLIMTLDPGLPVPPNWWVMP